MNAQELIQYIATAPKKTPVKLYIKENAPIDYGSAKVFGAGDKIVFGDWAELAPILEKNRDNIGDIVIENDRRNHLFQNFPKILLLHRDLTPKIFFHKLY